MNSIILYIKESYNELIHKVTWSSLPELLESTRVVIIGTVIFSIIVLLADIFSKFLTTTIYHL
ncbi:MAG TPA: preprotein translocase subunit SecE [Saprospiraceae bacterium]|nr:preprotein translocase subunit SecE [Saprospiraceae bacterium]